jgi:cytochrome c oxidase subunit 4
MTAHVVPVRVYVTVFLLLMVLTGTTVGVAFIDLGPLNTLVAVTIAVIKMMLVVTFFMHARQATALTRLVIAAGFLWLMLLMAFTLTDVGTRRFPPDPAGWGPATVTPAPSPTR